MLTCKCHKHLVQGLKFHVIEVRPQGYEVCAARYMILKPGNTITGPTEGIAVWLYYTFLDSA